MDIQVSEFMEYVKSKNPGEEEFHQAVEEVVESIIPVLDRHPQYKQAKVLERMIEPERVVMFRVPWLDDAGEVQINKGYRVEFSSAIGPYKGGLRFHPSVNLGILKFLGFEQILKNSLTTLPMGGGKGGSDFDPKGKSDNEVMRFCQSFMTELFRHVGAKRDIPAGDIGVGGREIGYLFGQYKRLTNRFEGVLTGKAENWGGSLIRPEATGYGAVYFAKEMLKTRNQTFEGKKIAISGSGNVAQFAAEKALDLGGIPITLSDSGGSIYDEAGIDREKLSWVMNLKNKRRGRIKEYADEFGSAVYLDGDRPWNIKCDVALPCAIENEVNAKEAQTLVDNGCFCISEGANMPSEPGAIEIYLDNNVLYGLGKAANAGGVAVSGLEMSQNAMLMKWPKEEVDAKLHAIMVNIHQNCLETAERYGKPGDYVAGANIAGFLKVADAIMDMGVV